MASSTKVSASLSKAVHADVRIDSAFASSFAGALLQGAKGKSGLFEAPASVALASLSEALARMLVENPTGQDLMARTNPSMLQALHLVMGSGNAAAVAWSALALSQIALRRPDTAITIASLPLLAETCSVALGPNNGADPKAKENVDMRDNTALLVNNVAASGGDEAINILCKCQSLILVLVERLSSGDSPGG